MRIFLSGVVCVGKTTIGGKLAELLDRPFFDLDEEIEAYFDTSIERLLDDFLTIYSFRKEASKALTHLLARGDCGDSVVALPPNGLMDVYWRVVKKAQRTIIVVKDAPGNFLERNTFYDKDSRPIEKLQTDKDKRGA